MLVNIGEYRWILVNISEYRWILENIGEYWWISVNIGEYWWIQFLSPPGVWMANLPAFIIIATGLVVFTKEGGVVQWLQRMLCAHLFTKTFWSPCHMVGPIKVWISWPHDHPPYPHVVVLFPGLGPEVTYLLLPPVLGLGWQAQVLLWPPPPSSWGGGVALKCQSRHNQRQRKHNQNTIKHHPPQPGWLLGWLWNVGGSVLAHWRQFLFLSQIFVYYPFMDKILKRWLPWFIDGPWLRPSSLLAFLIITADGQFAFVPSSQNPDITDHWSNFSDHVIIRSFPLQHWGS